MIQINRPTAALLLVFFCVLICRVGKSADVPQQISLTSRLAAPHIYFPAYGAAVPDVASEFPKSELRPARGPFSVEHFRIFNHPPIARIATEEHLFMLDYMENGQSRTACLAFSRPLNAEEVAGHLNPILEEKNIRFNLSFGICGLKSCFLEDSNARCSEYLPASLATVFNAPGVVSSLFQGNVLELMHPEETQMSLFDGLKKFRSEFRK